MSAPALDSAAVEESLLDSPPELVEKRLRRRRSGQAAVGAAEMQESHGGGDDNSSCPFSPEPPPPPPVGGLQRRASQKELRQSFARSKVIHVNLTHDEQVHARAQEPLSSACRRALLRKASSLPPSTAHLLSALLESRARLPRCPPTGLAHKRRLWEHNEGASERQFFLELVKDISNDLDLGALSYKILIFVCLMVDADRPTAAPSSWSTAAAARRASSPRSSTCTPAPPCCPAATPMPPTRCRCPGARASWAIPDAYQVAWGKGSGRIQMMQQPDLMAGVK